jgi:hypothetical protein
LTQQVLESKSLFDYRDGKNSRDDAWESASDTIQRVEFLLRGHAHRLPGTQWNRWLPQSLAVQGSDGSGGDPAPTETIAAMQGLVDRMWEEGYSYMTVRAGRMEELLGPKSDQTASGALTAATTTTTSPSFLSQSQENVDVEDSSDSDSDSSGSSSDEEDNESEFNFRDEKGLAEFFGETKGLEGEGLDRSSEVDLASLLGDDDDENEASYLNDFGLPGPTTHMFDILLDSVACHPTELRQGFLLLQNVLGRHGLDGGDERNTNEYTRPTVLSYNAPIRLAANLPYDRSDSSSAELRDEALQLALGSFDALAHSSIVARNSATYSYLLRAVAKYLPTSATRGNIALGIFHHARVQGLVDDSVLAEFLAAHSPSNGEDFDRWIAKHLGSLNAGLVSAAKDLPHRWRRHSRARRYHPRESTY